MRIALTRIGLANMLALLMSGCVGTPGVQYHLDPAADAGGYRFVLPRTIVKVSLASAAAATDHTVSPVTADHSASPASDASSDHARAKVAGGRSKLSLTPVPVRYDLSNKSLPVYSVTDDTGGWSLVSTSVTNVKYTDYLIIQSIGTQVTDNRKDAISTVVAIAGALGAFAAATTCSENSPLTDFVIEDFSQLSAAPVRAGDNNCWGYQITTIEDLDPKTRFPIPSDGKSALPTDKKTSWFPYPACKAVTVSVFPCEASDVKTCNRKDPNSPHYDGVISVADGSAYRRVPLPQKGKVEMHTDFCVADVTSDASPLSGDWSLLSEAIKDVQGLKQKKSSSSK